MPPRSLRKLAQDDTPSAVNVPNSWLGIAIWVTGRFGGSALVAIGLSYGIIHIYADVRSQTERVITVLEKQAEVTANSNTAMFQLRQSMEDLVKEAKVAHNRIQESHSK